jgi:carbon storage regulator CsrA
MLVLTRKTGESVVMSVDGKTVATIRVQNFRDRKCCLAFDAAPSVKILREELCQATAESESDPLERE